MEDTNLSNKIEKLLALMLRELQQVQFGLQLCKPQSTIQKNCGLPIT